jgi:hypothetical protein
MTSRCWRSSSAAPGRACGTDAPGIRTEAPRLLTPATSRVRVPLPYFSPTQPAGQSWLIRTLVLQGGDSDPMRRGPCRPHG